MAKSKNKQLEETKIIKSYSFQLPLLLKLIPFLTSQLLL